MKPVYVVVDDGCVEYAGTSFVLACAEVRGSNVVSIWINGQRVGYAKWDFKKQDFIKKFDNPLDNSRKLC